MDFDFPPPFFQSIMSSSAALLSSWGFSAYLAFLVCLLFHNCLLLWCSLFWYAPIEMDTWFDKYIQHGFVQRHHDAPCVLMSASNSYHPKRHFMSVRKHGKHTQSTLYYTYRSWFVGFYFMIPTTLTKQTKWAEARSLCRMNHLAASSIWLYLPQCEQSTCCEASEKAELHAVTPGPTLASTVLATVSHSSLVFGISINPWSITEVQKVFITYCWVYFLKKVLGIPWK